MTAAIPSEHLSEDQALQKSGELVNEVPAARSKSLGTTFNLFWLSATVSRLGDGLGMFGFPLLIEAMSNKSAALMAFAYVPFRAPWLFGPLIGAYVDRCDARTVLVVADVARAVVLVIVLLLIPVGISIAFVFLVALAVGLGECFADAAVNRVIPKIIAPDQLMQANSRLYVTQGASEQVGGYALGGPISTFGLRAPLFFDAFTFLASALALFRLPSIPASTTKRTDERSLRQVIVDSFRWARTQPPLVISTQLVCVLAFTQGMQMAIAPVFMRKVLHLSLKQFGLFFAIVGIGGILGSAVSERLWKRFGASKLLIVDGFLVAAGYAICGLTRNPIVAVLAFVLESAAVSAGVVCVITLRQRLIPEAIRGGVMNAIRTVTTFVQVIGALLAAVLAALIGPGTILILSGVLLAIGVALMAPSIRVALATH
jgi:MFS family permease